MRGHTRRVGTPAVGTAGSGTTATGTGAATVGDYYIFVGGGQKDGTNYSDTRKAVVLRLKENGDLDAGFAQNGRLVFASRFLMKWSTNVSSIAPDGDKDLYLQLRGSFDVDPRQNNQPSRRRATVAKISEDGAIDSSYGTSGEADTTYVTNGDYHEHDDMYFQTKVVADFGFTYLGFTYVPQF
jgi:hypothetical protein